MDSDDDDFDYYKRPSVLPVADFDDYDPSKPPATGEEYLRRVQLEAMKCPEVSVADLDVNSFLEQRTETMSQANGFVAAKPEYRIPLNKQDEIIAYFTRLRMRVADLKKILPNESTEQLLPANDHQAWKRLICADDDDTESGDQNSQNPHPPHLTVILRYDQVDHHKFLQNLHVWMDEDGYSETIGLWIFSVLACIEKPIHSDVYATLRDISRTLSTIRKEEDFDECSLKSINTIICIIGRYFDQKDMVDE